MMRHDTTRQNPAARAETVPARGFRTNAALAATLASLLTLTLLALVSLLALGLGGCTQEAGGEVQVSGILTGESTTCQALTSEDGELYALTGDLGDVQTGDVVDVTGTLGDEDDCDGGIVVHVTGIEVVEGPNAGNRAGDAMAGAAGAGGMDGDAEGAGTAPVGEAGADTLAGEQVLLEGELTDPSDEGGVECQGFLGDDGELYTLTGDLGGYTAGDRVRIVGTPAEASTCTQGQTIEIVEIGPADDEAAI